MAPQSRQRPRAPAGGEALPVLTEPVDCRPPSRVGGARRHRSDARPRAEKVRAPASASAVKTEDVYAMIEEALSARRANDRFARRADPAVARLRSDRQPPRPMPIRESGRPSRLLFALPGSQTRAESLQAAIERLERKAGRHADSRDGLARNLPPRHDIGADAMRPCSMERVTPYQALQSTLRSRGMACHGRCRVHWSEPAGNAAYSGAARRRTRQFCDRLPAQSRRGPVSNQRGAVVSVQVHPW